MIECKYCGARIHEDDEFCASCGKPVERAKPKKDLGENPFVFGLISFFMPLFGFILYLLNKRTEPGRAKTCMKWTIFGTIFYLVVIGLLILFYLFIIIEILT